MKKIMMFAAAFIALITFNPVYAHFGMVVPTDTMIMVDDDKTVGFQLSFSHPFETTGMELVKPKFSVYLPMGKSELTGLLNQISVMGKKGWEVSYRFKRPGAYWFVMEPKPYWESTEDCFIIHYTKTMVAAFGDDEGWDKELGLKTEIVPLSKPFGLYAGNVFQGIVKLNGRIVPYSEVEVEHYNQTGTVKMESEYMITQTIRADSNGVFTYATPGSGWWGFAALNEADFKLDYNNVQKNVELGAVLWVKFHDWQK